MNRFFLFFLVILISHCALDVNANCFNPDSSCFKRDTTAPTVSSVTPSETEVLVDLRTPILVTFSEVMQKSSLTFQAQNGSCSESIQVSADNFTTCLGGVLTVTDDKNISIVLSSPQGFQFVLKSTSQIKDFTGNSLVSDIISTIFSSYYYMVSDVNGILYVSIDASNWQIRNSSLAGDALLATDAKGNWVRCLKTPGACKYSSDAGKTWSDSGGSGFPTVVYDLVYGNGNFVVSGDDNTGNGMVAFSTDNGVTFSPSTLTTFNTYTYKRIGFGMGSRSIAAAQNRDIFISNDNAVNFGGIVTVTSTGTADIQGDPNGTWILLPTTGGNIFRSANNGDSWVDTGQTVSGNGFLATDGSGVWVTSNLSSTLYSSDNGVSWATGSGAAGVASGLLFGSNRFISVGNSGVIIYSIDNGKSWQSATISGAANLTSIAYGY